MYALLIRLPHSIIVDALNTGSTEMNKKMQPCMAMAGKKNKIRTSGEREREREKERDRPSTYLGRRMVLGCSSPHGNGRPAGGGLRAAAGNGGRKGLSRWETRAARPGDATTTAGGEEAAI